MDIDEVNNSITNFYAEKVAPIMIFLGPAIGFILGEYLYFTNAEQGYIGGVLLAGIAGIIGGFILGFILTYVVFVIVPFFIIYGFSMGIVFGMIALIFSIIAAILGFRLW